MPQNNSPAYGMRSPSSDLGEYNQLMFVIKQQMAKLNTSLPVKVMKVNTGGVGPVGSVDVQILVDQMTGDGKPIDHVTVPNVPYIRIQGGNNAIIVDPVVGDIGLAVFCSRDISSVKSSRGKASPGSWRTHDFSDCAYIGGMLNGTPTRYIQLVEGGIVIHAPDAVTIEAPSVTVNATTSTVNATTATISASGAASMHGSSISVGAPSDTLRALIDERILNWCATHTHLVTAIGAQTAVPLQVIPAVQTSTTKAG